MSREEEIEKAIYDYSKKFEKKMNGIDYFNHEHVEHAFIDGIEWADNNPKSPWISVNEDLPNNPKYLKQPDFSSWVIAVTENTEVIPAQMIIMNGKWIWHSRFNWKHEDITHWMFIPKLPPEFV